MDNREIALKLTIASIENKIIEFKPDTPEELKPEIITDFYRDILYALNLNDEK